MTSRERVLSSMARKGYDRIPIKHEGTPEINQMLMNHFELSNFEQLLRVVGDDFRYVEGVYCGPELHTFPDGSMEGFWGERYKYAQYPGGRYLEAVHLPFAGIESLERLDRSHFPRADWFDYSTIKRQCLALHNEYAVCFGTPGDLDFINGISRCRGMEQVLLDLALGNPVYLEIMNARFQFYYDQHERALQAGEGLIDITHTGEDLGNQKNQTISMKTFEKYFAPKYEKYFAMVHKYGAKAMHHMCGCVEAFLPRLIELGLDILDVVQPTTPEMDIAFLKKKYGDKLDFTGTMCVQTTLAFGAVHDVISETKRRLELFPRGGLNLGPTHAIQVGTPLENILAMYRTAGSLIEKIDERILSVVSDKTDVSKITMSKLF